LKTVEGQPSGGSNPSLSAKNKKGPDFRALLFWFDESGFEPENPNGHGCPGAVKGRMPENGLALRQTINKLQIF